MARTKWGLPVPASGEVHWGMKGKVGSMKGFRRGGFRRKFSNRFWVPYLGANGAAGGPDFMLQDGSAQQLIQIVAGFGLGPIASVGSSASTMEGLRVSNIIRIQGGVDVTATPPLPSDIPPANGQYPQVIDVWYFWQRQQLTPGGNTGSIEAASNYDPNPFAGEGGLLVNILRQNTVLSWGRVRLAVPDIFDPTAAPAGTHRGHVSGGLRNVGRIPPPRIGKMGLKLSAREVLALTTSIQPGDMDGSETGTECTPVMYMPVLRMLCGM